MSSCKQKGGSLASKRVMNHVNGNLGNVKDYQKMSGIPGLDNLSGKLNTYETTGGARKKKSSSSSNKNKKAKKSPKKSTQKKRSKKSMNNKAVTSSNSINSLGLHKRKAYGYENMRQERIHLKKVKGNLRRKTQVTRKLARKLRAMNGKKRLLKKMLKIKKNLKKIIQITM